MGLFSKSKKVAGTKAKEETKNTAWHMLTDLKQLEEIVTQSKSQPVAIFKHSTRCGISKMVLKQFESSYNLTDSQLKLYYLDLLNYRNISDEIGFKFQVMHQSPQLIVIKNGVAVANASHNDIQAAELQNFL
jgi:bacillithiol system protein YtxJ